MSPCVIHNFALKFYDFIILALKFKRAIFNMDLKLSQADIVRINQGKRGRRQIHPELDKDFVAKKNRNSGLPYKGQNGNFHPGILLPVGV